MENNSQESVFTQEEINQCITFLNQLNSNTNRIFEIPKEQRISLLKAAGQLAWPSKEELAVRKKGAKKLHRKKEVALATQARNATGIRSA